LPALHVWLWLPLLRQAGAPARLLVFAAGLTGPLIVLGSLAWRFGLSLDAPWYLLELVAVGYISTAPFALALAGAAAAGPLTAAAVLGAGGAARAAFPGGNGLIAFGSAGQISVLDAAGGAARALTAGRDPEWSPDGTKLLFWRIEAAGGEGGISTSGIYVVG